MHYIINQKVVTSDRDPDHQIAIRIGQCAGLYDIS